MEFLSSEWLYGIIVFALGGKFVTMFPKEKILKFLYKPSLGIGIAVSKFLMVRFGKNAAHRVEEGAISTILVCLGKVPLYINEGLLSDNDKKLAKRRNLK